MPSIQQRNHVAWSNYHRTRGTIPPGGQEPQVIIDTFSRIEAGDLAQASGLERFAASGSCLLAHLRSIEAELASSPGLAQPVGMVGQSWSFSRLIGMPSAMLDCTGLAGITELGMDEWFPGAPVPADRIALVSGGTLLNDVAHWAETRNRTLSTSGTHLKPTIAGGAGTASHGSRLGYGGLQDMIVGMHILVGSGEHVWIERRSRPVLSGAGVAKLAIDGVPAKLVRDDEQFEDMLVHLGGMGLVNGVAMELAENHRFALMQRLLPLSPDILDEIGAGQFSAIAARLGCAVAPEFYELTLNPHAPFGGDATHIMYFKSGKVPLTPAGDAGIRRPADVIAAIGANLLQLFPRKLVAGTDAEHTNIDRGVSAASIPPWVLPLLLDGADSVFAYYRGLRPFESAAGGFDPDDANMPAYLWSELHPGEITGGIAGALYNASFAIPLDRVSKAIPAICAAVAGLAGSFVFTIRFVTRPSGTLAFTRFDHNAVIEIDGLSPFICQRAALGVDPSQPQAPQLLAALRDLAHTLPDGAAAVRGALDGAGIPYSMHWAKLGELDRAKVHADFGHPLDPDSLIGRWRTTRETLLTPFAQRVFWNDALIEYGLIDPV